MIWVYQVITLPMIIWLTRVYVEDIPIELEESCFCRWSECFTCDL